jgi:two-component system, cell cycle response regulator
MAKILVIEDNPANLDLITFLLGRFGHECLTAADGIEGVGAAREHKPDLILCDIQMPRVDGYGVVRILKDDAELCAIPVMAVSSYAMHGDKEKALARGFDGYITKPIDPLTVVGEIEQLLGKQ